MIAREQFLVARHATADDHRDIVTNFAGRIGDPATVALVDTLRKAMTFIYPRAYIGTQAPFGTSFFVVEIADDTLDLVDAHPCAPGE